METFTIPTYPINKKYEDEFDYAGSVRQYLCSIIESEEFCQHFGVVRCGMGGGYVIDFSENDYWEHYIELCVFVVKPEKDYKTFAEVIESEWSTTVQEVEAEFNESMGFRASEIPCLYVFETEAEAREWAKEEMRDEE